VLHNPSLSLAFSMKRLAEFLRFGHAGGSAQLLFLAGGVCLVIAPRLSWWPAGFEVAPEAPSRLAEPADWDLSPVILFPILFAGIAAYFIALLAGPRSGAADLVLHLFAHGSYPLGHVPAICCPCQSSPFGP